MLTNYPKVRLNSANHSGDKQNGLQNKNNLTNICNDDSEVNSDK